MEFTEELIHPNCTDSVDLLYCNLLHQATDFSQHLSIHWGKGRKSGHYFTMETSRQHINHGQQARLPHTFWWCLGQRKRKIKKMEQNTHGNLKQHLFFSAASYPDNLFGGKGLYGYCSFKKCGVFCNFLRNTNSCKYSHIFGRRGLQWHKKRQNPSPPTPDLLELYYWLRNK